MPFPIRASIPSADRTGESGIRRVFRMDPMGADRSRPAPKQATVGRGRWALVGAIGLMLTTACAEIPTSGEVVEGDSVSEQLPVVVGFEPNPPPPGATETGIVQGFLDAMASYEPQYSTAREFLTPDAQAVWTPSEAMTIYSATPSIE